MTVRCYASIHAISFSAGKVAQKLSEPFNSSIGALISNSCHEPLEEDYGINKGQPHKY